LNHYTTNADKGHSHPYTTCTNVTFPQKHWELNNQSISHWHTASDWPLWCLQMILRFKKGRHGHNWMDKTIQSMLITTYGEVYWIQLYILTLSVTWLSTETLLFSTNKTDHHNIFGFPIFWFWAYLMKVILSVPDEGYFERIWWRLFWAYLMKVILSVHDEGYFEHTWWRLFLAYLMKLFWAYLMKVILSIPDEGYF
jgi:hypothetical protein